MCGRPPPGKVFFGSEDGVGRCGHVSGLLLRSHMTAGPDEVRGTRSHSGHRAGKAQTGNCGLFRSPVATVSSSRLQHLTNLFVSQSGSNDSSSRLRPELLISGQQRPDDPRHFVGKRDCCQLVGLAGEQLARPPCG